MKGTIIYIGGEFPDKDASALRILANCRALGAAGYEVKVISPSQDVNRIKNRHEFFDGFEVYYYPYPRTGKEWFIDMISIKSFTSIIKNTNNLRAVICYNHHAISLLRLISFCHKRNVAVLCDCTEWHTTNHLRGIKRIVKSINTSLRIKYAQRKSDGIMSISTFFAKMYSNHPNVIVVPPLIDIRESKWDRSSYTLNTRRTFSYTGRMGIGKDLLFTIIQSFLELNDKYDFQFNILGCTKDEFLNQHPDESKNVDSLGSKIIFKGYSSHETAIATTKQSDFSFLIRDHNRKNDSGFPTKLGESIACGTPVIATDFSDVKQYILDYKVGMVIQKQSLREAIEAAINMSDDELNQMKSNCRECTAFDFRNYISIIDGFISKATS